MVHLTAKELLVLELAREAGLENVAASTMTYAALFPIAAESKFAFECSYNNRLVGSFRTAYANFAQLLTNNLPNHGYVPLYVVVSAASAAVVLTAVDAPTDLYLSEEQAMFNAKKALELQRTAHNAQQVAGATSAAPTGRPIPLNMNNIAQAVASFEKWLKASGREELDHDDYEVEDYELTVLGGEQEELSVYLYSAEHRFTCTYIVTFNSKLQVLEVTKGNEECRECMREAHDRDSEANRLWDEGR